LIVGNKGNEYVICVIIIDKIILYFLT